MRISYSDEEDYPGQFALWDGNCRRSMKGRSGQAFLRRLEFALLAMPDKRLIRDALIEDGDVCAIGALARHEGKPIDPSLDYDIQEFGEEMGAPSMVAWSIVAQNDVTLGYRYVPVEGPQQAPVYYAHGPIRRARVEVTPEERYDAMLAWVRSQLIPCATQDRSDHR